MPPLLPAMSDIFNTEVIPLLQRRGAVPHGLFGRDAARALRPRLAEERLHGGRAPGDFRGSSRQFRRIRLSPTRSAKKMTKAAKRL